MLKSGDMKNALNYVMKELAPSTKENPQFKNEFDILMTLFAFKVSKDSPNKHLLDFTQL